MPVSVLTLAPLALAAAIPVALPDWSPATPERLAAKAEIEALEIEYYYRVDHGPAESAADLYTPDGVLQTGTSPELHGREAIRAFYAQRNKSWVTRHITGNMRLRYIDATHVEVTRAYIYFRGDAASGPGPYPAVPAVAEYVELVVKGSDGQWRYASRIAKNIFTMAK